MKDKANKLFDDAIEKLNEAREELFRPEEDLVSYLVCKNSQYAIENFLIGYLLQNGNDPSSYKTIDSLYEECKTINKNFEKVDLSDFECKYHKIFKKWIPMNKTNTMDNINTINKIQIILDSL